jgi:Ca2+-binding EF-hand superfamily protein
MLFTWLTDGGIGVAKLALLKMLKVARMLRFGRLITRVTAHRKVHTGYVEACKFFIYVLYVAHILACLFFLWSELFDCQSSTCTGTADIPVCEYTSGTTGCPAGCTDDGATCSGTAVAPSCTGVGLKPGECPAGCTYTPFMLNEWDLDVNSPLMEIRSGEIVELDSETLTERNDCVPTSWRHAYSMAGVSVNEMLPWSQWTQAFYWAITTMTTIGYGDRGPQNESEMVFTIVAELVGLAFFALLIQTINTLKEVIGLKEQEQRDTKNKLVDQMKRNDLSDDLIAKVVKFLNFKNTSKAGRAFLKEDPDFNELSHALQRQVSRETNLPYVKNVKILGHSMDDQLEMDNVKDIFEEANEGDDPNPALDRGEINNLVLKLGVSSDYFTKERLDEAMNSMDSSGDGEVELDEFQNWWYTQLFKRPRMKPCPKGLLDEIAECLECVPASPGDIIVPKLKYGESFFVLQAGKVVKRASDPKDRYHITETEVKHDDNDPFFGLQAVLPDLEFERIRPRLATMEIVVAENSYVECLSIKR